MSNALSVDAAVEHAAFQSASTQPEAPVRDLGSALERLHDVPVELTVELGRTRMTIGGTLALGPGSIVPLRRLAGDPVDLLVNGKRIAYGEVVVIDEEFGLRITEVADAASVAPVAPAVDASGFTAGI